MTKIYAAVILPGVFGLATKILLRVGGASVGVSFFFCLVVMLLLWLVGDEVESYYFREIREGREERRRAIRFYLLLPAIYAAALVVLTLPFWEPVVPLPLAICLSFLVCSASLWFFLQDNVRRGGRLYRQAYAAELARRQLQPDDKTVAFGGIRIALSKLCYHMCFIGTTGSGKTTALKIIMADLVPLIGKCRQSLRAVIYDPKTEFYGYLSALASCPVYSIHPLDTRGRSWNMAKSIRTPMAEHQFAITLIPRVEGPNAFFSNSARSVLAEVLRSLNLNSPGGWSFANLIWICETEPRIRAALSRNEETKGCIRAYLDAKEASSILSELDTRLRPFRPIAACWEKAEPIDLEDVVRGEAILILPMHRSAEDQLRLLNGLILSFLQQQLLDQKTNEQLRLEGQRERGTFIIFDEVRDAANRLPDLKTFFTLGRAYGISNIIGYQSQPGMTDALDQHRAAELLGQCHFKGLLSVNEKETAQYLSDMCHEREVYLNSSGGDEHVSKEAVVMPAAFSQLKGDMLRGYYMAPEPIGLWKSGVPWPERKPVDPGAVPDFLPRDDADQNFLPMTITALKRLKLPGKLLDEPGEKKDPPVTEPVRAAQPANEDEEIRPKKLKLVKKRNPPAEEEYGRGVAGGP